MSDPTPLEILNNTVLVDAPTFACVLQPDDTCIWMNRYMSKSLGMPSDQLECLRPFPLLSLAETADGKDVSELCARGQSHSFDAQIELANGEPLWVSWHVQPLRFDLRLIMGDDCTERKNLEQQVLDERAILKRLVDLVPYDILWTDSDMAYVGCNQAHASRLGVSHPSDLIGQHVSERAVADGMISTGARERAESFRLAAERVMNAGEQLIHVPVSYLDDELAVHKDVSIVPLADKGREKEGVMAIIADHSERVRMEQQILHASKLEAVGQLAAGIAHEINTPVQFVGDNIRFLQDIAPEIATLLRHAQDLATAVLDEETTTLDKAMAFVGAAEAADVDFLLDEIPAAISQSLDGIGRIGRLVRAMKDFSHPGDESMGPVDINACISSTVTVATSEWRYVADVECDLAEDLPAAHGTAAEINQVILNLVVNASHAIADVRGSDADAVNGVIHISTRHVGDRIETRVRDTGTGIPDNARDRIFDPFFSTKEVGKGTGQGLAIAHTIVVNKHGGSLSFTSEEGEGTEFILTLPTDQSTTTA